LSHGKKSPYWSAELSPTFYSLPDKRLRLIVQQKRLKKMAASRLLLDFHETNRTQRASQSLIIDPATKPSVRT
jgi:hypothetical protein